jgi:hypothetical protein
MVIDPQKSKFQYPPPPRPASEMVDRFSEVRRQYQRAQEYSGLTIDDIVNSNEARRYLRQIWLLGCMVRNPHKANVLPPGNPFRRGSSTASLRHSGQRTL